MAKWAVVAIVTGNKYLGTVEAKTEAEALEKAEDLESHISLCHACSRQCEDPQITQFFVEEE